MKRLTETRKIRDISEGNFHNIQASNKAEKLKYTKLSQGIESCRNAQVQKYRKEERELWKTLDKINLEKSKHYSEEEQFFCDYSPGDGVGMISFCDLSNQSDQDESVENQEENDQGSVESLQNCFAEEKEEEIGIDENEAELKLRESVERLLHSNLMEHHLKQPPSSRRSSLKRGELSSAHRSISSLKGSGSDHMTLRNRRRPSAELEETVPFYMKKKYDNHINDHLSRAWTETARLRRRNALTLEDEQTVREWQSKAPSADLDTITFGASNVDRKWFSSDIKKEREKTIKKQSTSNMETAYHHRPLSGLRRISMALERMPSEENLRASSRTPRSTKNSASNLSPKNQQSLIGKKKSEIRKLSLPFGSGSGIFAVASKEKLHLSGQRRHTVGEIHDTDALQIRKRFPDLKDFKSKQDLDGSAELVSFEDNGVIFPAFEKDREYSMKEFISLRKCRYLRLSKLNWESLQWQSMHQKLIDY